MISIYDESYSYDVIADVCDDITHAALFAHDALRDQGLDTERLLLIRGLALELVHTLREAAEDIV